MATMNTQKVKKGMDVSPYPLFDLPVFASPPRAKEAKPKMRSPCLGIAKLLLANWSK